MNSNSLKDLHRRGDRGRTPRARRMGTASSVALGVISFLCLSGLGRIRTVEDHLRRFEAYAAKPHLQREAIKAFELMRSQYPELLNYPDLEDRIKKDEDLAAQIYTLPNISNYDAAFVEQYVVDHQDSDLVPDLLKKIGKSTIGERSLELVLQKRAGNKDLSRTLILQVASFYLQEEDAGIREAFLSFCEEHPHIRHIAPWLRGMRLLGDQGNVSPHQVALAAAEFCESAGAWQPELALHLYGELMDMPDNGLPRERILDRCLAIEQRLAGEDRDAFLAADYVPAVPTEETVARAAQVRPDASMQDMMSSVDPEKVKSHILALSSLGSRMTGSAGCERAAQYVEDELRKCGLSVLPSQTFSATVPVDKGARVQLEDGTRIPVLCYWPNLVRTSTLPIGGLSMDLRYGARGRLEDFEGIDVENQAVLLEFDAGMDWIQCMNLGARVLLFIEPEVATRQEAEKKFLSVPVDIPRFWVPREDGLRLKSALQDRGTLRIKVDARMDWEKVSARNVVARIDPPEQVDASVKDQKIILSAYYDSISVTPAQSPGSSSSCGIAVLLEVARLLSQYPPDRTVVLVATSSHFMGMAGAGVLTRAVDDVLTGAAQDSDYRLRMEIQDLMGQRRTVESLVSKYGERPDLLRAKGELQRTIGEKEAALTTVSNNLQLIRKLPREDDFSVYRRDRSLIKRALKEYGPQNELISVMDKTLARYARQKSLWRRKSRSDRRRIEKSRQRVNTLFIGLDVFPESSKVGFVARGSYEDNRDIYRQRDYAYMGRQLRRATAEIAESLGQPIEQAFADTVNATDGREVDSFFPELFGFESEVCSFAFPAVTLATCNDGRSRVNTPQDTVDRWTEENWDNVNRQARFISGFLYHMVTDPSLRLPKGEWRRMFAPVGGKTVYFDPSAAFVPDTPVPGAVLVMRMDWGWKGSFMRSFAKPLYGIHPEMYEISDNDGNYQFGTLAWPHFVRQEGYRLNDDTGEVSFAPDLGMNGDKRYNFMQFEIPGKAGSSGKYVLFPCRTTSFTDLVDPRYLLGLQFVNVLDSVTQNPPMFYGLSTPLATRYETSYVEPCITIYTKEDMKAKLTMSLGLVGKRFILINATPEEPEGEGYDLSQTRIFRHPNFEVARDVWILNNYRNGLLEKHGIVSDRIKDFQSRAREFLDQAEEARKAFQWVEFSRNSDKAWALASRIYPDILNTANDTVKGVIFYLALVVPFAYFLERILFSFADIRKRIAGTVGIFVAVLIVLGLVHPAFEITMTPFLIFLAFAILSLGILVTALLLGKFGNELRELRGGMVGIRRTDVNRFSAAFAAFSLGVSYMRRRRVKTLLTCLTLICLTFTVLSFTSLKSFVRFNKYELPWAAPYTGVLYRNLDWSPLEEPEVQRFMSELEGDFLLAPRSWMVSFRPEDFVSMEVESEASRYVTASAEGVVGMTPNEPLVSRIDSALLSGRWFQEGDQDVCLLPESMAATLGIKKEETGQARIKLYGRSLCVIGILDEKILSSLYDLNDDESRLTPISLRLSRPLVRARNEEVDPSQVADQEFDYMNSNSVIFVPYDFLMQQGGTARSIAAVPSDALREAMKAPVESGKDAMEEYLERMMRGWSIVVYVGMNGQSYLYSSIGRSGLQGMANVIIPMIIAGLIVLNTMLGSVYEREREIHTYSSVGLSPVHISSLFIAESCVYAVIGSISGYLVGQVVSKIVSLPFLSHALAGITLNYSSTSAVISVFLVMVVTVLSTLYPARRAHQLAVPDIERVWQVSEPTGEDWHLEMPFIVQRAHVVACNVYLREFFELHTEESVGNFSTQNVMMDLGQEQGQACRLHFDCWLAPYDFGVSQTVELITCESGVAEDLLTFELKLHRLSGDVSSWKRTNRLFLNTLRKCFLIWRVMKQEDRQYYSDRAAEWASGLGDSTGKREYTG